MRLTHYRIPYQPSVYNLESWFQNPLASFPALSRLFDGASIPGGNPSEYLATDIHEDKDKYYAVFEAPGVKKEDVKVDIHDRVLTVNLVRKIKTDDTESSTTSNRSISMPDNVKPNEIAAKLMDGILTVTLPKSEERKPRVIHIA